MTSIIILPCDSVPVFVILQPCVGGSGGGGGVIVQPTVGNFWQLMSNGHYGLFENATSGLVPGPVNSHFVLANLTPPAANIMIQMSNGHYGVA